MSAEHLQYNVIFMQHIERLFPHHLEDPRGIALVDNVDINHVTWSGCCCWLSLESHGEQIFVFLKFVWDFLSLENILVFVVVIDHLFLEADFHCLFLFAHDKEE